MSKAPPESMRRPGECTGPFAHDGEHSQALRSSGLEAVEHSFSCGVTLTQPRKLPLIIPEHST